MIIIKLIRNHSLPKSHRKVKIERILGTSSLYLWVQRVKNIITSILKSSEKLVKLYVYEFSYNYQRVEVIGQSKSKGRQVSARELYVKHKHCLTWG